jgi:Ni,Fe-hydrogenase maturation factor
MKQNQIHFGAEFIIEQVKIEAYKKLIQKMSRTVEANRNKIVEVIRNIIKSISQ